MPQLIPYFFFNQVTFTFISFIVILYLFSKYILPLFFSLRIIQLFYINLK